MLHHVKQQKNENETDKKMTIQVAELFFLFTFEKKTHQKVLLLQEGWVIY